MAVYSTMIRDDPDSRARLRVTPEQILNLPVHHCLASWIAGGTRAASFIGQTFPFPTDIADTWARTHLARLHDAVGPYPETLASTLTLHRPPSAERAPPALADAPRPSSSAAASDHRERRTTAATADTDERGRGDRTRRAGGRRHVGP